jgi:hypothetical protein
VAGESCNIRYDRHAATGNPLRSIRAQNCSHRSGVYVRHRTPKTAAAPRSFHRIPERQSRCFTSTLHAASVTPEPIGMCFATNSG